MIDSWHAGPRTARPQILTDKRIGVEYAGDWALRPWHYLDAHSRHVTVLPAGHPQLLIPSGRRA